MNFAIIPMTKAHWPEVAAIYQEGIEGGNATFKARPPESWNSWQAGKIEDCSLVAIADEHVLGWVSLSPTSARSTYAGVAEVSVYVSSRAHGQGVGLSLLQAVIQQSERKGIWTLQAAIFPENQASLALHARAGFRTVGRREKLGKMTFGPWQGQWRDVFLLERRSPVCGVDE